MNGDSSICAVLTPKGFCKTREKLALSLRIETHTYNITVPRNNNILISRYKLYIIFNPNALRCDCHDSPRERRRGRGRCGPISPIDDNARDDDGAIQIVRIIYDTTASV